MNSVVLIGRLTRDPELRYTQGGTAVAKFALAVDKQLSKEKKEEFEAKGQPTADFINITVWGRMAENCANYLVKGRLTGVAGRIQSGSYLAEDGTRRYTTDVVAREVKFLEWRDNSQGNQKQGSSNSQTQSSSGGFSGIEGFDSVDDDNIPF